MAKCNTWDIIKSIKKKEEDEKRFRERQAALKKKGKKS